MNWKGLLVWMGMVFTLGGSGCVTEGPQQERRSDRPRFEHTLPAALAIQIKDQRPAVEWGGEEDEEWIYPEVEPGLQGRRFVGGVGNALVHFGAVEHYALVKEEVSPSEVDYLMRIYLVHWYARWPVEISRGEDSVPVEGKCEVVVQLFRQGRLERTLRHAGVPEAFPAPLNVIHAGNVEKIIRDSLVFQSNRARDLCMDRLMADLAARWPRYAR